MSDVGYKKPPLSGRIKKGEVRNPLGGRAHDQTDKLIRRLTQAEIADIGTLVIAKNITKLRDIIRDAQKNPDSKHSALKVWMAAVAIKAMQKGDAHSMDVLLNRIAGKVKDHVEVTGSNGGPVRSIVGAMSKEERQAELKRLSKMRKDAGED